MKVAEVRMILTSMIVVVRMVRSLCIAVTRALMKQHDAKRRSKDDLDG